jgi:methyl-accepting chemotaxis protein
VTEQILARPFKASVERIDGRRRTSSRLQTIQARLYLAFALAAGITVLGSLYALLASTSISTTLTQIAFRGMPASLESFRLSEEVSALVAFAPSLMSADNERQRIAVARDIEAKFRTISAIIERLRRLDASENDEIEVARSAMNERFDALNKAVAARIEISLQRHALTVAVRRSHEQLLEAITPVIDDANFDLMTKGQASSRAELNQAIDSLHRLLEVQADSNLLAGLLIESSLVTDIANLPPMRDLIAAAERNIGANLKAVADSSQRNKITDLYGRLAALGGDSGIIVQRTNELKGDQKAQQVYAAVLAEATRLRTAVDSLIARQGTIAQALSSQAISQMQFGRFVLITLSITALAGAGLIAWLYVGRSIVRRLALLSEAMRRIAAGEANVSVPVGGQDEIAEMAGALLVFRQAITDVRTARQSEAERARDADLRRQQIEVATQDFERAVNDIIQALDGASQTMDGCAQIMAQAASHNLMQADATANASEEATTNVSSVAMAAKEIAQSVEEISDQARGSADNARQASGEARSVISTVERLASAVGQINDVSNFIRNIAAQTNLLALNATIEAARAGAAGRSFAVVAQEVKQLAAQTEKATGDITQQISSIDVATSSVVQAMKAIVDTIAQLDENATQIAVAVQQQDAVSKEIARSANAAAEHTREVSSSIVQVSDAANKTNQVAKAVLDAGSELAAKSSTLRAEVERFLVKVRVA